MDVNAILQTLGRMFPNANLKDAVGQAQQAIQGTPDNLMGVAQTAKNLGITPDIVEKLYSRYGTSMQARAVCSVLGTTPEALKSDADRLIRGGTSVPAPSHSGGNSKFPRLK